MSIETPQILTGPEPPQAAIGEIFTATPASTTPTRDRVFAKELLRVPAQTVIPGPTPVTLKSDVFASIDWNGDGVIIRSELFDEEGYGWTYEGAWSDFLISLRDKYHSLERRQARLSPADRDVFNHLRQVFTFDP